MKKVWMVAALLAALAMIGVIVWLLMSQQDLKDENAKYKQRVDDMQELVELEKQEMENDYALLDRQYSEMMTQITNDSLIAQLTREQLRAQQLLEELRQVKADNAAEIKRLRKELESVRAVLRSYIRQVDSLNMVNQNLRNENFQLTGRLEEAGRVNQDLEEERQQLTERVNIAAQLDATNIALTPLNKRNKVAKKMKDCKNLQVNFTISRNVTAQNGSRMLYVRIQTPSGTVLPGGGTFAYENRQIEYSMKKLIEYNGEETPVVMYWQVGEYLSAGDYIVSIFTDTNMIGSRTFNFAK